MAEGESAAGVGAPAAHDDRLVVALVRGAHGLAGAVRVEILTDRPEDRYAPRSVLYVEGSDRPLTIVRSSAIADGPGWRLQFAEVDDRAAAEALFGSYLEVPAGPDAALPRGAYFWHEVIGSTVTGIDGTVLGTVRDVYRSGGAEVYVVNGGPYGEFDVPGVRDFVRIFAPKRGEIVVDVDALDLGPPKSRRAADDPERPRAPRRRAGPRRPKGRGSDGSTGESPPDGPAPADPPAETGS
ncbi:MAG TPA: ribosome maturation factor RimM [Candidatus Limnocylindrales bacterium]|nr:ribosome maturation factor RimM [Candidatus Limnocylindrales bacterium]